MIKKRFLKTKPECKVNFKLPKDKVHDVEKVSLVGDFNDWNPAANPMKKLSNGDFSITLNLPKNSKYQFKYFVDGDEWYNDEEADDYIEAPFPEAQNSLIVT